MLTHHRLSIARAILLAAGCAIPAFPGTTVTIGNQSGKDLMITRAAGKTDCPILVTGQCDAKGERPLCRLKPRPRTPFEKDAEDELFSPGAGAGPAPAPAPAQDQDHFLLPQGHSATLAFEHPKEALEAELVFYHLDRESGVTFNGIVIFSFGPKPAAPGSPEPEAWLRLAEGPTLRTRSVPCNRSLQLVSDRELQVLPQASRARTESGAVSPFGLDLEPGP